MNIDRALRRCWCWSDSVLIFSVHRHHVELRPQPFDTDWRVVFSVHYGSRFDLQACLQRISCVQKHAGTTLFVRIRSILVVGVDEETSAEL